jgi:TFIIF-interacting CTD phosphatase-like protein
MSKDWKEKKPLYKPVKSSNPKKKGMVYVKKDGNKRLIHFGDSSMKDFTQHKDKERRKNYLARSAGIKNKSGKLTKDDKNSANYWSRTINW